MSSAFKRPGSDFWYAAYRGPKNERIKKASPYLHAEPGSKKRAEAFASELERTAKRARQGLLTETKLRHLVGEIWESLTDETLAFQTVQAWLDDWVADKEKTNARATFLAYRKAVQDFLLHIGKEKAARGLEKLTTRDFQTFRDKQIVAGKTPQTANNILKVLRIPFALARKHGLIPMNPAEAVQTLPPNRAERGTFTVQQLNDLVAAAEKDWRGAILTGIYTGQRLGDIADLLWEAVDLPGRTVAFVQTKGKRRVLLPLHDVLEAWLLEQPAPAKGATYVFPTLAGKSTGGAHGLSGRFKAVMQKAGIDEGLTRARSIGKSSKGRAVSSLSFHSLRHTFNSIMANAGVAQEVRQELTGHASAEMNKIYTHHELSRLRTAVESLPSIRRPV